MARTTDRFVTGRNAEQARRLRRRAGETARACALEHLEGRALLSFSWTSEEVYLSELVNRARANPTAEAARLGLDLSSGLTAGELARLVPQEPLALNRFLTSAARAHSLDMAARNFFDHTNPDGLSPTQRAQAAGYGGTAGENIAAGYTTIDAVHRAWLDSVGHRKNVLSLHSNFDSSFHYDEFGPGIAMNAGGTYNHYFTELFGYQGSTPSIFLLGVVFNDADSSDFYGIGEGATGVRIDVAPQSSPGTVVGTYTTDAAGNYQIPLAPGAYTVTFTRLADGAQVVKSATVGTQNIKLDAETGELQVPSIPDDFADAGDWAGAGVIALDPALGNGLQAGNFESAGDTDLFRFIATRTGVTTITLTHPAGAFAMTLVAYNGAQVQVATGVAGGDFGNGSVVSFTVNAGQTYYLLARPSLTASIGDYLLLIQGPPSTGGGQSDDTANIGNFSQAGTITLDSSTGSGTRVGYIEYTGDSDVFRMVATRPGTTTIVLQQPQGTFAVQLRLFNAAGDQIITGSPGGDFGNGSTLTFTAVQGETYYVSAEAIVSTSRGIYVFQITGPGPAPVPPPPVTVSEGHKPVYHSQVTSGYLNGRFTILFTNQWGQPLIAHPNPDGSWTWGDVRGGPATPEVDGEMVAWVDPREGVTYFAIRGNEGLLLFREDAPNEWSYRNLSDEIDLSLFISADMELIFDPLGRVMLAGASDGGDLILYNQTLQRNAQGQYIWTFRNVTALDLEPKNIQMPFISSELISWTNNAKACHVGFIDENGDIQVFFKPKGKVKWTLTNVSNKAPNDPLVGELTVTQTPRNNGIIISGTAEDGGVWVTTFRPRAGWKSADLSAAVRGPDLAIRSIVAFYAPSGFAYVAGIRSDGRVFQYRYNPGRNTWMKMAVHLDPPDFRNMAGRLSATVDSTTGEINLVGTLDSQRVIRWTWAPGQNWVFEDISLKLASVDPF